MNKLEKEIEGEKYKGYRVIEGALVYQSKVGFFGRLKQFIYELYHPANYQRGDESVN